MRDGSRPFKAAWQEPIELKGSVADLGNHIDSDLPTVRMLPLKACCIGQALASPRERLCTLPKAMRKW
jgi:hypothetical protein